VGFSLTPGVSKPAVHVGIGTQQRIERERTDDREKQQPQADPLAPPA